MRSLAKLLSSIFIGHQTFLIGHPAFFMAFQHFYSLPPFLLVHPAFFMNLQVFLKGIKYFFGDPAFFIGHLAFLGENSKKGSARVGSLEPSSATDVAVIIFYFLKYLACCYQKFIQIFITSLMRLSKGVDSPELLIFELHFCQFLLVFAKSERVSEYSRVLGWYFTFHVHNLHRKNLWWPERKNLT